MDRLRIYWIPLTVGLLLLCGIGFWALQTWQDIHRRHRGHVCRFANDLFQFVAAYQPPVHQRRAAHNSDLRRALQHMMHATHHLVFALALHRKEKLIHLGDVPPSFSPKQAFGQQVTHDTFILWRPLAPPPRPGQPGYQPEHSPGARHPGGPGALRQPPDASHPRGEWRPPHAPPPPEHACHLPPPAHVSPDTPTLVLGVRSQPPPHVFHDQLLDMSTKIAVALLAWFAMLFAWWLSIRSRNLAIDLETERVERTYYEDLSLAAAGLAHETKNPLGMILGLAQRIHQTSDPDRIQTMAEQIEDEAERASVRLSEFITYARPREIQKEELSAQEVIEKVMDVLIIDFESSDVSIQAIADQGMILADREMLSQILINLLLNSLYASAPRTQVTIRFQIRGESASLCVEDQGHGISSELLPDVFKPYISGRPGGHGLGLSIVKRLVEKHAWSIRISSQEGEGTQVMIENIQVIG